MNASPACNTDFVDPIFRLLPRFALVIFLLAVFESSYKRNSSASSKEVTAASEFMSILGLAQPGADEVQLEVKT